MGYRISGKIKLLLGIIIFLVLSGCTSYPSAPAPVIDGWQTAAGHSQYKVQKGDTLYSIAWTFDVDYRDIARVNKLTTPYQIHAGQVLNMNIGSASTLSQSKVHKDAKKNIAHWLWPAKGKVVNNFSSAHGGSKGIDIKGKLGEKIIASAGGVVVYSGSGLRSYGNLIIIKHNDDFLSAYAHNKLMKVKEGQIVKAGQEIATMGKDDDGKVLLHFEIRRNGKPINPLPLLG